MNCTILLYFYQLIYLYKGSDLTLTHTTQQWSWAFKWRLCFLLHIASACVERDAYQSWILSSLCAGQSHSVAADTGPVTGQDRSQNLPRGAQPSGWRVTVYNAGFSPLYALILSIVLQLSQLPIRRVSEDHVTLPHPLFAKHPAFSTSTLFYCVFSKYLNTLYAQYLAVNSNTVSHSIALYALSLCKSSQCKQWVYSVLGVDCFVCGNHRDRLRVPSCVRADVSTHSPSLCFDSLQTIVECLVWSRCSGSSKCSDRE